MIARCAGIRANSYAELARMLYFEVEINYRFQRT
jgi:hypothetical protein